MTAVDYSAILAECESELAALDRRRACLTEIIAALKACISEAPAIVASRPVAYRTVRERITGALADGPLRAFEIADRIGTSKGSVLTTLSRMRHMGLVEKRGAGHRGGFWYLPAAAPEEG